MNADGREGNDYCLWDGDMLKHMDSVSVASFVTDMWLCLLLWFNKKLGNESQKGFHCTNPRFHRAQTNSTA